MSLAPYTLAKPGNKTGLLFLTALCSPVCSPVSDALQVT